MKLSNLKAVFDTQTGGDIKKIRKLAKEVGERAGVNWQTVMRAYAGVDELQETKARKIQAAMQDQKLTTEADVPLRPEVPAEALTYPQVSDDEAMRRFRQKEHEISSQFCTSCWETLRRLNPKDLPVTRAVCKLRHGYVQIQGRIVYRESDDFVFLTAALADKMLKSNTV